MKISIEEVEKIARLARLDLAQDQMAPMAVQLSHILDYMDTLSDADVSGVAPASGAACQTNVLRLDTLAPSPGPDITLANAPERDQDFYVVPRIV